MKKFLFLLLSLAVASSAVAGVNFQKQKLTPGQTTATKVAPTMTKTVKASTLEFPDVKRVARYHAGPKADIGKPETHQMRDAVTEQPEGTVKYYQRTSGTALYLEYDADEDGWYYTADSQSGLVKCVENGSTIWFKNLLYDPDHYFGDYWIQGTNTGSRVTITLPQSMETFGSYGDVQLVWGKISYSSGFSFAKQNNNSALYNVGNNGTTLSLQNTTTGTGTYAAYTGTGLSCYLPGYSATYCLGFCEWKTVLTEYTDVPEAPEIITDDDVIAMAQQGGYLLEYNRTGESFYVNGNYIYSGTQYGYTYVYFTADFSEVYLRDPVYGEENGTWVKGTFGVGDDGYKITVPLGQYIYYDDDFYGLRISWGTVTKTTTDDGTSLDYVDGDLSEVTYTVSEDFKYITLDGTSEYVGLSLILDQMYEDQGWYGDLDYSTTYIISPVAPDSLTVAPTATTGVCTWEGNGEETWNLRYRPYVEGADYFFCDFDTDESLDGWVGYDADGDGNWWGRRTLDEGYCLTSASWTSTAGALNPDNWLVSPALVLNGTVKFKAWGQDPSYAAEVFRVYITTNTEHESTSDFVDISADVTVDGEITEYSFDIPEEYQGQQGCVAIRHYNVSDEFMINIDDFYVGNPDVVVPDWEYIKEIDEIPYTIEGLTPETTYEVQVQSYNEGGASDWTESTIFTTLAESAGLRGDVNNDGKVSIADVTALINALLTEDWDSINVDNADCDLNGEIKIGDVTALINYLLTDEWGD